MFLRCLTLLILSITSMLCVNVSHAKSYKFVIVGAKLFPNKTNGTCWDFCTQKPKAFSVISQKLTSAPTYDPNLLTASFYAAIKGSERYLKGSKMPDPYVTIKFGSGAMLRTPHKKNTIVPHWGMAEKIKLSSQETIQIKLWDKDLRKDDLIGQIPVQKIPTKYLQSGGTWRLKFGRVFSLDILIVPEKKTRHYYLQPGHYKVSILGATIRRRKKNGKRWDGVGKPDPYTIIHIGTYKFRTHVHMNTYQPVWNYTRHIHISGHERFEYKVIDKDWQIDDTIGLCYLNKIQQAPLTKDLVFRASCEQVKEIVIKFERKKGK